MSSESEPSLQDLIARTGVRWRVNYSYGDIPGPQIVSTAVTENHDILLPYGLPEELNRIDFLDMLTRAKLAETHDPIFSTIRFHSRYDIQSADFRRFARRVEIAQRVVEVWSADIFTAVDRRMAEEDVRLISGIYAEASEETVRELDYAYLLGYALMVSVAKRGSLPGYEADHSRMLDRITDTFGRSATDTAEELAALYSSAPPLPEDRNVALKLFETKTDESAEILGIPISPEIMADHGIMVWVHDRQAFLQS